MYHIARATHVRTNIWFMQFKAWQFGKRNCQFYPHNTVGNIASPSERYYYCMKACNKFVLINYKIIFF